MLDVHPPHPHTHTWRDFFIHIATIVVGLLIAVGLEQTVEYFHHRHLASEARAQLSTERDQNQLANDFNIFATDLHRKYLHSDLAMLHAIRDRQAVTPGPFILRHARYLYFNDEWLKVHQSGSVGYIHLNLAPTTYRYENQDAFMARIDRSIEDLYRAGAVLRGENDPPTNTFESNIAWNDFLKAIEKSHETMSDQSVDRGFADSAEPGDVSSLTQVQRDTLEQAIKVALVDDDALLTYCFNIKRNLSRNPAP